MENLNLNAFLDGLALDPWVFIVAGAILTLLGLIKIVGKGISLLIWALLVIGGVSALNYGLERQDPKFSSSLSAKMLQAIQPGKELSQDALRALCTGMETGGSPSSDSTPNNPYQ
ncbi:MAG: hypothetical protein HQL53_14820 [Magnetococcales bacterium]|nr:hypothetical protein [Magnetococcales bacterium]